MKWREGRASLSNGEFIAIINVIIFIAGVVNIIEKKVRKDRLNARRARESAWMRPAIKPIILTSSFSLTLFSARIYRDKVGGGSGA